MCYLCPESRTPKYRQTQRIIRDALRRWPRYVGPQHLRDRAWAPSWGDSHDWTQPAKRQRLAPPKPWPYRPEMPAGPASNRYWRVGVGLVPGTVEQRLRAWNLSLPLNREGSEES